MILPTKKSEPVTNISDLSVLVYGAPKIGKSTWCSHTENALFLETEPGLNNLEVFKQPVRSWKELLESMGEITKGEHDFKTIVVDTVDNMYRLCTEHVLEGQQIEHESDLGYGKAWALVRNEFHRVLTKMARMPYGLYLVSHAMQIEIDTRTGKQSRYQPTLPGKARETVVALVDIILYCDIEPILQDGKPAGYRRVMRTKNNPYYEAGDRTGKLPETIPLDFGEFAKAFVNPKTKSETTKKLKTIEKQEPIELFSETETIKPTAKNGKKEKSK